MEKDMALIVEKGQRQGSSKGDRTFQKKWIPFILEFAQVNLRKASEDTCSSTERALSFSVQNPLKDLMKMVFSLHGGEGIMRI